MVIKLPSSPNEFSDPSYWKKFFEKCDTAFEWYGDYSTLGLERYLKPADQILQIGCGNSILADQLYDNGFRHITSIDTDAKVIQKQQLKNSEKRPELSFVCRSGTQTELDDKSVNIVVDKGTLDALSPANADDENKAIVTDMFTEIDRVLAPLGRYIVVTLAQDHIVHSYLNFFRRDNTYLLRIHKIESDKAFSMPVYLFIATKLRSPLPKTPPIEWQTGTGLYERLPDEQHLQLNLRGEREFAWIFHKAASCLRDEVTFTLNDALGQPRYIFTILDDTTLKTLLTYGVFIVPHGHENDWLFTTAKGRATLRKQCNRHRLLLVYLIRGQIYLSIEHIELEITDLARRIAPPSFANRAIEFLSLGRTECMETIAEGASPINGKWTVEHVHGVENKIYRRLIFVNNSNLIQSEKRQKTSIECVTTIYRKWQSCTPCKVIIKRLSFINDERNRSNYENNI